MIPSSAWLRTIWSDSAFPAGGASHSSGLEGALQSGYVRTMPELSAWISDFVENVFGPCDLAALMLAHRAACREDWQSLYRIDERLGALKISREEREASVAQGQSRLEVIAQTLGDPRLRIAWEAAQEERWSAHAASVWGLTGAVGDLTEEDSGRGFTYTTIAGIASAAIRMRFTGQQGAQGLLASVSQKVEQALQEARRIESLESLASVGPRLELAQMHHETARVRLFMS